MEENNHEEMDEQRMETRKEKIERGRGRERSDSSKKKRKIEKKRNCRKEEVSEENDGGNTKEIQERGSLE